jgi:c-di-GMP-binding flagellar brake protein YcgR
MQNNGSTVHSELRASKRKVLKVKALLAMEGDDTIMARTADVGADGLCLLVGKALKTGAVGMVRFELFQDGKVKSIAVKAAVQYCILSNGEYKVGFRFVNLQLSAMASLAQYLH